MTDFYLTGFLKESGVFASLHIDFHLILSDKVKASPLFLAQSLLVCHKKDHYF
jgi:hypothetical protein